MQLLQIVLKVGLDGPGPSEGKNVQTVAHSPIHPKTPTKDILSVSVGKYWYKISHTLLVESVFLIFIQIFAYLVHTKRSMVVNNTNVMTRVYF